MVAMKPVREAPKWGRISMVNIAGKEDASLIGFQPKALPRASCSLVIYIHGVRQQRRVRGDGHRLTCWDTFSTLDIIYRIRLLKSGKCVLRLMDVSIVIGRDDFKCALSSSLQVLRRLGSIFTSIYAVDQKLKKAYVKSFSSAWLAIPSSMLSISLTED
ncbi:hypothetical protein Tco_0936443 [Tanacetum coccineum]